MKRNNRYNMKKLTATEEQIMQLIWDENPIIVSEIISKLPPPKPPHSTISSVVRILEKKGFVDHKAYGRTHVYFPIIAKEDYTKRSIKTLITDYFKGSPSALVSFLIKEKEIDEKEINDLINAIKDDE